jgi:mono/diheme cytochrome c family protein
MVRGLIRILLALVGVCVLVVVALLVHGYGQVSRRLDNPVPSLVVAPDSALIPRGRHLVQVDCAGCHSGGAAADPVLSGGAENFLDIPGGPRLGVLHGPNLTPGGVLRGASDGQISRAVREGVGFDGRPLLVMPSPHYHAMSDRDLAALIAFLRSQPAVEHVVPARRFNPLAYLILGLHQYETSAQLPVTRPVAAPAEAPDSTYGAYLTPILGCADCHGSDYGGGRKGQFAPLGPSLVSLVREHPLDTFEQALRHGIKPAGGALDPNRMPWPTYSNLTDLEVRAVYEFLRGRPER